MSQDSVSDLKGKISTLEARIAQLESKLGGQDTSSEALPTGVRMILMGPPGAGESALALPMRSFVCRGRIC